jgi:hypothetical protein
MDKSLDSYVHPKLNQEDINHLKRYITQNEIEAAIKSLPKKKSSSPHRFSAEFYQTLAKTEYQLSLNCSMKYKGKENYLTHFMKSVLHLSQNHTNTHPKRRTIGRSP